MYFSKTIKVFKMCFLSYTELKIKQVLAFSFDTCFCIAPTLTVHKPSHTSSLPTNKGRNARLIKLPQPSPLLALILLFL